MDKTEIIKQDIEKKLIKGEIYDDGYSLTLLHLAVLLGDIKYIQKYIKKDNVNLRRGKNLYTPAHILFDVTDCTIIKKIEIIRLLCKYGANLNIRDINGESCLYKSTRDIEDQYLVPILLENGSFILENDLFFQSDLIIVQWLSKIGIRNDLVTIVKNMLNKKIIELNLFLSVF